MGLIQVSYEDMDPVKKFYLKAGLKTLKRIQRLGGSEVDWTRGESFHAIQFLAGILVSVTEGLGTKNKAADLMAAMMAIAEEMFASSRKALRLRERLAKSAGFSFHRWIGQCNVAMVVGDLLSSGVSPSEFMLHVDIGADWLKKDERRWKDLAIGTARGCRLAGCVWGGGETAELNILAPDVCVLSGMSSGFTTGTLVNPASIKDGDIIVIFHSSGPQANGYTGIRDLADNLPDGYLTEVPGTNGKTFGELILTPTHLYTDIIERCRMMMADIHAIIPITGHGFCKLMRPKESHAYVIDKLPPCPPIFEFIQNQTGVDHRKMFKTFNMGAGLAICLPERDKDKVRIALQDMHRNHPGWYPFGMTVAGHVEASRTKSVHIVQKDVHYKKGDLDIR